MIEVKREAYSYWWGDDGRPVIQHPAGEVIAYPFGPSRPLEGDVAALASFTRATILDLRHAQFEVEQGFSDE